MPTNAPLARVSWMGVRSPEKCGKHSRPLAPFGLASAAVTNSSQVAPTASWSRNQRMSVPDVARPAIEAWRPGAIHGAYHSRGSRIGRSVTSMMNIVEPYISIISPGDWTPTLTASAAASIVPTMTGVPWARPVSDAAAGVTPPAISVDHASRGNRSSGRMSGARSAVQSRRFTS